MRSVKHLCLVTLLVSCIVQLHFPGIAGAGIRCYARDSYSENFILALQETLKANGIDPGPLDGLWGPKTEKAIEAFQRSKGLPYGFGLNGPTCKALFGEGFVPERYGLLPNPFMPAGIYDQDCR